MKWTWIEKRFGLSPKRKEELKTENRARYSRSYLERRANVIKNLYLKGMSIADLAKAYATTEAKIRKIVNS